MTNQRQVVQVRLLTTSGYSLTARESSSQAVRVLIAQMPGPRTFIGAKGMQQESRSSRPLLAIHLCSGRSYAPLRQSKVSSSSKDSGSGFAKNSRIRGESRLSDQFFLPVGLPCWSFHVFADFLRSQCSLLSHCYIPASKLLMPQSALEVWSLIPISALKLQIGANIKNCFGFLRTTLA